MTVALYTPKPGDMFLCDTGTVFVFAVTKKIHYVMFSRRKKRMVVLNVSFGLFGWWLDNGRLTELNPCR